MPQQLVVPVSPGGEAVILTKEEEQAIYFFEFLLSWSVTGATMH